MDDRDDVTYVQRGLWYVKGAYKDTLSTVDVPPVRQQAAVWVGTRHLNLLCPVEIRALAEGVWRTEDERGETV